MMARSDAGNTPKKTPGSWKGAFLAQLCESPNVAYACSVANIGRAAAYNARKTDATFASKWDEALAIGVSTAEDEAWRRAVEGTDKPVFQGGEQVGVIREYSDTLLIFMLKSHKPQVYREQSVVEHTGSVELKWVGGLTEVYSDGE